jgi:ComF family protein
VNILWRLDEASEKVVYSLKFDGRDDVATSVARQLTSTELPFFDLISFVPDTSARRRKRGYVAPQLVARELSRLTRKPYVELLERTTHQPQVGSGREARWRQVKNNFCAKNLQLLEGRRILLVDDVITTGATVTECARELKMAGSGPVFVAAVAKK